MSATIEPCDRAEFAHLQRRLERERAARLEMETIYEKSLRELYLREQELRLLQDIATAANLSQSVRDVFQFALTRICEYMAWPVGHVHFVQAHEGSTRLRSIALWHTRDAKRVASFRTMTEARDFAPGEGLPGRVYLSREATWLADVASDTAFPRKLAAAAAGIRAACAFPILVGEEIVAVVEFYDDRAAEPDAALLQVMPQVGMHLGRAIERQRAEDRLVHDAAHDPLTRLPNRTLFIDRLSSAIVRGKSNPQARFAVLFLDLDRFKIVNDSLGHLAGDALLVQVGNRLKIALRSEEMIAAVDGAAADGAGMLARLGGDEFIVLLDHINDPDDAVRVADRVQDALRLSFTVDGQEIFTSASVGIATSGPQYEIADTILRDADIAMYRAKTLGGARCELFDQTMHAAVLERLALETDLRRAVQNEEFVLHYQPIVSLLTRQVVGFEALVRWVKPDGQLAYPVEFIEAAEDTGLIIFLGRWVLREACRSALALQQQFPREDPLSISVNVSPRQFAQPDLVNEVRLILAETGLNPRCLRLEITETVMINDTTRVAAVLTEMKELGVRVSIDDFGTGYSSLSYLHALPLDVLKIDRSFVAAMDTNAESLQIVKTIIGLAHGLGMGVVAEGAERASQIALLNSMGCEFAQSYYFSKPVDLADAALLTRTGWPVASTAELDT